MGLIDRFLRKQKQEQLEKQAEKQQEAPKVLKSEEKPKKKTAKKATEDKETAPVKKAKVIKKKFQIETNDILIKPLITEKISDGAVLGKYAFMVSLDANKLSVKKAVSNLYNVKVQDVRMINVIGKSVRYGRYQGKRRDWKKALVTLAPGEKIEVYEGV